MTKKKQSTSSSSSSSSSMRMVTLFRFIENLLRRICINPCRFFVSKLKDIINNKNNSNTDHPIFDAVEMMPPKNLDAVREVFLLKNDNRNNSKNDDDSDNNNEDLRLLSILQERRSCDGATPFHVAVMMQDIELVRLLLDVDGSSSNNNNIIIAASTLTDHNNIQTPLHLAALTGNKTIVRMLVENYQQNETNTTNNNHIDFQNQMGHTAFFLACWRNHLEVAQYLVHKGRANLQYNLTIVDSDGQTLLDRIKEWKQTRIIEWLEEQLVL